MPNDSQLRIGILVEPSLPPNEERVLANLGNMLSEEGDVNLDIIGGKDTDLLKPYFSFYRYISNSNLTLMRPLVKAVNCLRYVRNRKPDILFHTINPNVNGLLVALVGKLYRTKVVTRMPGDIFNEYRLKSNSVSKIKLFLLNNILARCGFMLSDKIVILGPNLAKTFSSNFRSNGKIKIIPQPIDMDAYYPASETQKKILRRKIGVSEQKRLILFVGRLTRLKGAEIMLSIVEEVLAHSNNYIFYFIGEGPFRCKLESFDPERVRVIGTVPIDEIDIYYKSADLFLYPSLTEGLPNVILEAMACGLPIAASPVGEIPSLVSKTFSKPSQFVEYILSNNWKVDPLPLRFEWNHLRNEYVKLFQEVTS